MSRHVTSVEGRTHIEYTLGERLWRAGTVIAMLISGTIVATCAICSWNSIWH